MKAWHWALIIGGIVLIAFLIWYFARKGGEQVEGKVEDEGLWTEEDLAKSKEAVQKELADQPVVPAVAGDISESQAIAAIQEALGAEDITGQYAEYKGRVKPDCTGLWGEAYTECFMTRLKIQAADGDLVGMATAIHLAQLRVGGTPETVRQIIDRIKAEAVANPTSEAGVALNAEKSRIRDRLRAQGQAYAKTWIGLVETTVPMTPVEALGRGYTQEEVDAVFTQRESDALTKIGTLVQGTAAYQEQIAIIREERAKRQAALDSGQ